MPGKVVVTNRTALARKYAALGAIDRAIGRLIAADAKRGLRSQLIDLSDAAAMQKLGGKPAGLDDERAHKAAVDAIFAKLRPDYLVLLGAGDVVPHISLRNPVHGRDEEEFVPSDIPYACDTAYGQDPAAFVAATRVVTRLPDLSGGRKTGQFTRIVRHATTWRSRPAARYVSGFGLSAAEWKGSSAQSLTAIFGNGGTPLLSPPHGPAWSNARLRLRAHFINCHGGDSDPQFYGQKGRDYPVAMKSELVRGHIGVGTIASVECCYGAQLYPLVDPGDPLPICLAYLDGGAYAFFGSTTTAYGPSQGNAEADLITQYFLRAILVGASVGRGALQARQQFVASTGHLSPYDLKTLVQFLVLGDASIHPVLASGATAPKRSAATGNSRAKGLGAVTSPFPPGRSSRRKALQERGILLLATTQISARFTNQQATHRELLTMARDLAFGEEVTVEYANYAASPAPVLTKEFARAQTSEGSTAVRDEPAVRFHVATAISHPENFPHPQIVAVVAREEGDRITSVRTLFSR
jgi:hypothetical protein